MQYCAKCKVTVRGRREQCPLCQGPLTGEGDERGEAFPVIPQPDGRLALLRRFAAFISIVAVVVSMAVNAMLPGSGNWSWFVLAGIACSWLTLTIALQKLGNIPKSISWVVFLVCVLAVVWDACTGWHGWALDYVLPCVCVAAMIAMAVLARVLRLPVQDYMIYVMLDALFGIVPIVFYLCDWLRVVYPSLICVAGSVISLAALLTFEGENMRAELRRHFHL